MKKVLRIKKELDKVVNSFNNQVIKLEIENDCKIHHFSYLDIIIKDLKQHVFYAKKNKVIKW